MLQSSSAYWRTGRTGHRKNPRFIIRDIWQDSSPNPRLHSRSFLNAGLLPPSSDASWYLASLFLYSLWLPVKRLARVWHFFECVQSVQIFSYCFWYGDFICIGSSVLATEQSFLSTDLIDGKVGNGNGFFTYYKEFGFIYVYFLYVLWPDFGQSISFLDANIIISSII